MNKFTLTPEKNIQVTLTSDEFFEIFRVMSQVRLGSDNLLSQLAFEFCEFADHAPSPEDEMFAMRYESAKTLKFTVDCTESNQCHLIIEG